jgi:hypothetical protein
MPPVIESSEDARQSRRRGCRQRSAAASHGVVARAGSAKANGLDTWPDRPSTAAFDSEPDSRVLELASSDDLANAVGDRLARARSAAVRRATARLDYAVPHDFNQVADRLQERAADRTRSPVGSASLSALRGASCTPNI